MSDDIAIKVEHVGKTFHEQMGARSLKQVFLGIGHKIIGKKEDKLNKGEFTALKDINFEVKKGEFFGIVGRNGCGKSTLLKIIAGVYSPTKGAVTINGKLTPFIELGVGFNPELSGRDNVFLNGALLGFTRKQMEEMYDDIVEFAELKEFMDVKLKNYSSGMQVRLAFSVAIRAESDILLIDEVLAVGDAAFQQKCYDYFEQLKEAGRTVVFVSHDMAAVRRFCTRAVYVSKGRQLLMSDPIDISDMYNEDNMTNGANAKLQNVSSANGYQIDVGIIGKSRSRIEVRINYKIPTQVSCYVGISVIRDGFSFAEITTDLSKPLSATNGKLSYVLETGNLNGGIYEIGAGLFMLKNRELLAFPKSKAQFSIRGSDITKGSAINLPDKWIYDRESDKEEAGRAKEN